MAMDDGEVDIKVPKREVFEGSEPVRCTESEERVKNAEARIRGLEAEVETRKSEYQELEEKCKALELRQSEIEDELKSLKPREVKEDEDELFQLKAENVTLACEKKKAENDVEVWKRMYHELKSRVGSSTGKRMSTEDGPVPAAGTSCDVSGTPCSNLPSNHDSLFGGQKSRRTSGRLARRHLSFEKEKDSIIKMAPSTPRDPKCTWSGIIDIDDSDDEPNNSDEKGKAPQTSSKSRVNDLGLDDDMDVCVGSNLCATTPKRKRAANMVASDSDDKPNNSDEKAKAPKTSLKSRVNDLGLDDDMDAEIGSSPYATTLKRKRAANVVTSDSESEDDNLPLSQLKAKRFRKVSCDANGLSKAASPSAGDDDNDVRDMVTPRRRRLKRMGESSRKSDSQRHGVSGTNNGSKYEQGIPTTVDGAEDSTSEEEGSGSSDDSMKEFIVESSDGSLSDSDASLSDGNACSIEGRADINVEMKDIVSKLQRSRDRKFDWESVGEMQSDFGKDNELCMRAVCALYRQQTCDEQYAKNTFYSNKRGFSQSHAPKASRIAAFLIDSNGDLGKSVEELRAYNSKAVDQCRDWALHYAGQLFKIYQSGEDPFFPPAVDK